ncbi:hypothetical protein [Devosia lacusdianchii]|uniref:hypothetical protein n=1 Tax=Devosia lacusdianchii TaxID=2917991 RepID=UPI001F056260|nr:hypothetical protein [Devosia sp. JXJ CY 41]
MTPMRLCSPRHLVPPIPRMHKRRSHASIQAQIGPKAVQFDYQAVKIAGIAPNLNGTFREKSAARNLR